MDENLVRDTRHDSVMDCEQSLWLTNANALCTITSCEDCVAVKSLPAMVAQFLENSQLPSATIAITYNILASSSISKLHCWHGDGASAFTTERMWAKMLEIHGPEADGSCQRALAILSALSLAVSFNDDMPRSMSYWSGQVAGNVFSEGQISAMNRILLAQLDWQLHAHTAPGAVNAAMEMILKPSSMETYKTGPVTPQPFMDEPLKLLIGSHTTIQHGLITPEASPDCSVIGDERDSYLVPV